MRDAVRRASLATLAGLVPHYLCFYLFRTPLWTDVIAEWIMARTPSQYAVWMLEHLGPAAKPFAMTGGLATLGFVLFGIQLARKRWAIGVLAVVAASLLGYAFQYASMAGQVSFWVPAVIALMPATPVLAGRREALIMIAGTLGVAVESYTRNKSVSRHAATPTELFPFHPPAERFAPGLVRKAVTPTVEFYGMSKNTVDPSPDPRTWRLKITVNGRTLREVGYSEMRALPRTERYVTLRCISNTLKSDLMGTVLWSGVHLDQLVDRSRLPGDVREVAIIGVDGHGDSLPLEFAFCEQVLLAIGMNGKTLDRTHGFPIRLLCPRFYGFKNVKWIGEIAFTSDSYFGTWPKMGYTKDPVVHTASHIDRVMNSGAALAVGGVSFAGDRGIRRVIVRADGGDWVEAELEAPLSPYTWTRWRATLPVQAAKQVEARAMDGLGNWQDPQEGPLFPDGVRGPTVKRLG